MGEWKKFMNNHLFCQSQVMASFSHFSWFYSHELFMITDLQGCGLMLSDPGIHSEDRDLFKEDTNLG